MNAQIAIFSEFEGLEVVLHAIVDASNVQLHEAAHNRCVWLDALKQLVERVYH